MSTARQVGKCLCGKVSYEVTGQPMFTALCHCSNCKRWTGAESGWYVFFNKEQMQYTKGQEDLRTYADNETHRGVTLLRNFCSACGSGLTVVLTARQDMTGVAAGTLESDLRDVWNPQIEVYCRGRAKWLPDLGLKQFETTPNVPQE